MRRARKPMRRRNYGFRRVRQPVQYFQRSIYLQDGYATSTTQDNLNVYIASLSQVPNFSDFSALYDQYKILKIKFELMPSFSEVPANPTVGYQLGQVISHLDYDSDTAHSVQLALQYQNVKITQGNRVHKRIYRPMVKPLIAGITGSPAILTGVSRSMWLDCAQTITPHYGLQFAFPQTTVQVSYSARITYYMAFKNVR